MMAEAMGTWPSRTVATFPGWGKLWPMSLSVRLSGTGTPDTTAGPGGGVRPWPWAPQGTQLHQVLPSGQNIERHPGLSLRQPVGAAAGAGQR